MWERKLNVTFRIDNISINFGFTQYTLMCVSTVYSVLTRATKQSLACYSGGIRTNNLCNYRAVSYQLDH